MNKETLVKKVAERTNMTQKSVNQFLDALKAEVVEAVAKGDKVQLVGFMTISPVARAQRVGRNPKTREEIVIPATVVPKATFGKEFKEAVAKLVK